MRAPLVVTLTASEEHYITKTSEESTGEPPLLQMYSFTFKLASHTSNSPHFSEEIQHYFNNAANT